MIDIINDTNKYAKLEIVPTINREGSLQRVLRNLKRNGRIDTGTYNSIYLSGSQPTGIYGLPKMHKIQFSNAILPIRPTMPSVNTFNNQLARYLCTLLQPHLPSTYTISDSFSFV